MSHANALHISTVIAPGSAPRKAVLFLHGVLGSGANLGQVARGFIQAHPAWSAVLVDLRLHGRSRNFVAPHTLAACAHDLEALQNRPFPVRAVFGHSLGGKVALQFLRTHGTDLDHVWCVDSTPSPGSFASSGEVARVFESLLQRPGPFASRDACIAALEERGHSTTTARWLAKNLEPTGDSFRLSLDVDSLRALLDDYFASDLWPMVEAPPGETHVHVIAAGRSSAFSRVDRARAARAADRCPRVTYDEIPQAGHWVHADAPDALLALMTRHLAPGG